MKTASPDGKLKPSDIIRADRIPDFGMSLCTTVRLTQSGWASCLISTWRPATGSTEVSAEHRFSSSELDFIRDALQNLSAVTLDPITCDDIPILRLAFPTEFGETSREVPEFHPTNARVITQPSIFKEVWNHIHRPFQTLIKQQAGQAGGGHSTALRATP